MFLEVESKNPPQPLPGNPDPKNGVIAAPEGGVNLYDHVDYDSHVERAFAAQLENNREHVKLFTKLPLDEIARLAALQGSEINEAKKVLATEATALVHGRAAADDAANTARKTFEEGTLAESLPTVEIATAEMQSLGVLNAFVRAGLASSNGDAKRQIKGGGLRVNDVAVTDEKMTLTSANLTPEGVIKLSLGRKRHVLIKPI